MYQIWHKSPMRSILLFFDKFFQVPYLSLLQNLSQIWDKSPMSGIFFLDSDFIVPNMRQITNEWYFISGLRFHCTKYETNPQWVVFFFLDSDFIVPNMKKITSHWWFVSYLAQWKSLVIRIIFGTMKISVYNFRSKHFIIVTVTYKHCQISYLLEKKFPMPQNHS